jgi:Sap, sulfolipid-1-addressing protein
MSAEFFALAFVAALNPKLLAVDLLLIENRRPRAMFLCVLLGGLTVGITIGLLDVLVFHADAINSQKTVSAGVDLAIGLILLAAGGLVATGRLHGRRKASVPAGTAAVPAGTAAPEKPEKEKKDGWAARVLAEPRLGLAMLVGALIGIPGAAYLTALHNLVTGKSSTATQVIAVVVFVLIEFSLIIIPFVFLELRPEATKAALKHAQDWLLGHARQLMAYTALILGAYLTVSALVRLG